MNNNKYGKVILFLIIAAMQVSACNLSNPSPTPTEVSLNEIYTAVAATVFAGQTSTAGAQPSRTLTPTATVTPTGTVTPTLAPTRAVFVPIIPASTAIPTTTGTPGTLVPTITGTYGAVGGKNSALVQDVAVPNMQANESFTKTWVIRNSGSVAWTSSYKITNVGGNLLGRDYSTRIFTSVGPGGSYTQNLKFTAPSSPGTYTGTWRLADESGNLFGAAFTVSVTVPGATHTPTSTSSSSTNQTATAAAATANANAVATAVAASATANANATANSNAIATAVAATQNAIATAAAPTVTNTATPPTTYP